LLAASTTASSRPSPPCHKVTICATRSNWQEVVRQIPSDDPNKAGQLTFEDVEVTDARMVRANRAELTLRRRPRFVRHEKKWQKKKRLQMESRYLRLKEGVEQLKTYIRFKKENAPED